MSFCANEILTLSTGIWQELGSPSSVSVAYISGWFTSSGSLGDLNNRLSTCFYLTGDSPCIEPEFAGEEAAVYGLIYKTNFYGTQVQALTGPAAWIRLSEGDSTIVRSDGAKIYLDLLKTNLNQLRLNINDYKKNLSGPRTVDAASLYTYPST